MPNPTSTAERFLLKSQVLDKLRKYSDGSNSSTLTKSMVIFLATLSKLYPSIGLSPPISIITIWVFFNLSICSCVKSNATFSTFSTLPSYL